MFHEYLGDNSQRDYRRRITAGSRSDTNWSHATVTGGVGAYDAPSLHVYIRRFVRRRACTYACMCVRVCCTRGDLNTDRCTGATSARRGNCGLAGPPGALRHHKAYGTGVVPVLNPASNTALLALLCVALTRPSALSSASRVSPCLVYASRSEGHRPQPTIPGDHYEQPRSGVTCARLFNNHYLWQKLARRPAVATALSTPSPCSLLWNLRPWIFCLTI